MIARTTTLSSMKTYRYNLQRSGYYMNRAMNTVQTGRIFNSFADDPATAALSFQKRRALLRNSAQRSLNTSIQYKYQQAWKAMDQIESNLDTVSGNATFKELLLKAENGPTASARTALGKSMTALAENMVQTMNGRYGENFLFAGADGLNVPFTWGGTDGRDLCYRGVPVSTTDPDELAKLDYFSKEEVKNADIGLGFDINGGKIESSSVFNQALQGVDFLGGYGVDEDGDPKNVIAMIDRMGTILKGCTSDDGKFASDAEEAEFFRLAEKFEGASARVKDKYIELDTKSGFLSSNATILEANQYNLQEQISGLEDVDEALAISDLIFAKYTYDTALKVGNSVLSQSLMDYMKL